MGALGSRRTARDHLLFGMGLALGAGLAIILGTLKNMRTPTGERLLLPGLTGRKGKRPKILLFGDSLTQKGFDVSQSGWVAAVANAYSRRADVVNRGFSGYNSRWCMLMLDELFPKDDPPGELPALAVVFLGANDAALPQRAQHTPVTEYQANLRRIVEHLRSRHPATAIVLIGPPPVDENKWNEHCRQMGRPPDRYNTVTRMYASATASLGRQLQLPVVDLWSLMGGEDPALFAPHLNDGLHFSASGNEMVASAVLETVRAHYPALAPEQVPMQAPEHFQLSAGTTVISL